jgi:hypothetical protein
MEYCMDGIQELSEIFRELTAENQAYLVLCARQSHTAENAVKAAQQGTAEPPRMRGTEA